MLSVIIAVVVVLLDQLSKFVVVKNLKPLGSTTLIDGILKFTYVENKGAAFGILSENRFVFMIASILLIALLGYVVYKYHGQSKVFDISLGLILGGGIGNMIDRIVYGYVIDFVDFCAFDFWKYVFNIADSAVVVGCIFAILFLLLDKNAKVFCETDSNSNEDNADE